MILVAGSANLDFVVRAARIPAPGETVLGHDFETFPGGKGANQAIACARAGGVPTAMLLALGDDAHAAPLEASLAAAGVRTHVVRVPDQPTGTAFICVAADGENAITVAPGANEALREAHLPPLDGVTHLLMQLETPFETVTAYARAAKAKGVKVVLNAAPARALGRDVLSLVDVLIVNEGELAALSREGAEHIDVPCLVVTLGAGGCRARFDGASVTHEGFAVTPVDTTAAGDTFCGALVAALHRSLPLADALQVANAAGALACTRLGAQSSIPTHAEVQSFLDRPAATSP